MPDIGNILESFSLPAMADAVRADEKMVKRRRMVSDLVALGERMGAKVEIK